MKIILKGVEKKLIDIKTRPMTKFDYLYKNIQPVSHKNKKIYLDMPESKILTFMSFRLELSQYFKFAWIL